MNNLAQLCKEQFGLSLSISQITAFKIYQDELIIWNKKFNLTAIQSPEEIINKHFLDSLSCSRVFHPAATDSLIDIGTGAGFPGIPLKIAFSELRLTLVDSVNKKVEFCRHLVTRLSLKNVDVISARAEEIGQDPNYREKYDWAVSRAVAALPTLVEYLLPLVKIAGTVIAQKGKGAVKESQNAKLAIQELGGELIKIQPVSLPTVREERFLIVIQKINPTPIKYPRRTGVPAKKPFL
jgi:16S rRNA (guanine527-N7)-methyltransferase